MTSLEQALMFPQNGTFALGNCLETGDDDVQREKIHEKFSQIHAAFHAALEKEENALKTEIAHGANEHEELEVRERLRKRLYTVWLMTVLYTAWNNNSGDLLPRQNARDGNHHLGTALGMGQKQKEALEMAEQERVRILL